MEAIDYKTESLQMIEVEIYETGEKTFIACNKQIMNRKNMQDRPLVMTAAEYKSHKTDISNYDM